MKLNTSSLVAAIRDGNIIPHFQPLVELSTRMIVGFEALARLAHPRRGLLLPGEFLPFGETSGIMQEISRTLLDRAIAAAIGWPGAFGLSINVTAEQLQDSSLIDQIDEIADRTSFPLGQLTVEVTETYDLDNLARVQASLDHLKQAGVTLALDDVGIGYSSLRYLQIFPFDVLKIDTAFIRAVAEEEKSQRIVRALIDLGHTLRLKVVAEGIETLDQVQVLDILGCDVGQGYLFGRPIAAESIPAVIGDWIPPASLMTPAVSQPQ